MATPLLLTKFYIPPPRPEMVLRPRLIEEKMLKLLRKVEEGVNLDLEIGRFLTEKTAFVYNPPVAGALEYRRNRQEPATLGILHGFVPNQGDAWKYTLDVVSHFYETALARDAELCSDI